MKVKAAKKHFKIIYLKIKNLNKQVIFMLIDLMDKKHINRLRSVELVEVVLIDYQYQLYTIQLNIYYYN